MEVFIKYFERFLELLLIFQPLIVAYIAWSALKVNRKSQIHNESMTLIELKREIRKLYLETICIQEVKVSTIGNALDRCLELKKYIMDDLDSSGKVYLEDSCSDLKKVDTKAAEILDDTTNDYKKYLCSEAELTIHEATKLLFKVESKAILNNRSTDSYIEQSKIVLEKIKAVEKSLNL